MKKSSLSKKINELGQFIKLSIQATQLVVTPQVAQQLSVIKKIATKSPKNKLELALLNGAKGTGKTTAAAVMATEAGKELFRVDLSAIVSKYIGETEKNIDVLFTQAANKNYILFFDEADALFGKRSDVKDSHDRYSNIETNYLLEKIEAYKGLIIAASTDKNCLDPKFLQHVNTTVLFRMPGYTGRLKMWNNVLDESIRSIFPKEIDQLAKGLLINQADIYAMAQKINEQAGKTKIPSSNLFKKYLPH